MRAHGRRRRLLVAGDDRLDDRRVLLQRLARPAGHHRQPVLVRHRAVAQVVDEVGGHGVPADLAQPPVERSIQFRIRSRVLVGDRGPHVGDDLAQLHAFDRRGVARRPSRDQPLECGAGLGDLDGLAQRDPPNRRATVRLTHDEPLRFQLHERRSRHRAPARVAGAELGLDQPFPRREHTGDDVVAEVVGDRLGAGDAQVRRRARRILFTGVDRTHRERHRSNSVGSDANCRSSRSSTR